jgi:hypothetical protein
MSDSEFLSPQEVRQLAGKIDLPRQDEALRLLGIPHRVSGRRMLVSRYHVREWLSGRAVTPSTKPKMELVK